MIYKTNQLWYVLVFLTLLLACSEENLTPIDDKSTKYEPLNIINGETVIIEASSDKNDWEYKITLEQLLVSLKENIEIDKSEYNLYQDFEILLQYGPWLILKTKKVLSWEEAQQSINESIGEKKIAYIHPYLRKSQSNRIVSYFNEIVVKVNTDLSDKDLKDLLKDLNIKVKQIVPQTHLTAYNYHIHLENEEAPNAISIAQLLLKTNKFEYAYPEIFAFAER